MVLALLLIGLFFAEPAPAFVLVSGPAKARLEVDPEQPKVTFMLSLDSPPITEKNSFKGGAYSDLSDEDFWLMLVKQAMEPWNSVADAYVELDVEFNASAAIDRDDLVHSIVVGATSLTSSAYAQPHIEARKIVDCDINVAKRSTSASSLAYTLMHELGHCLGFGHNHSDYSAVMGYSRTDRSLHLGLDDEAGLIFLYPVPTVAKAHELAACGTISGAGQASSTPYVLVLLPFVFGLTKPLSRVRCRLFVRSRKKLTEDLSLRRS